MIGTQNVIYSHMHRVLAIAETWPETGFLVTVGKVLGHLLMRV